MISTQVAEILLKTGAVKISVNPLFTWTSGIKSPIYCDNRMLISFAAERKIIVMGFVQKIKELGLKVDCIAGTATAAIPWAAFVAYELGLPMVYVRPEPKGHGGGKQVEGYLESGKNVLLIEDLISTGGSSIKAIEALEKESQAKVLMVMSIMTYEMDSSKKNFEVKNLSYTSLTNFTELAGQAKQSGAIQNVEMVLEFQKDPQNWAAKNGLI